MQVSEFKRRRRQLMGMMGPGSVAILPTSVEAVRNRDVHHRFRPDKRFYYLTGFAEPEAVMVLVPGRMRTASTSCSVAKDPAKSFGMVAVRGSRAPSRSTAPMMRSDLWTWTTSPVCSKSAKGVLRWDPTRVGQARPIKVSQVRSRARSGVHGPIEFLALDHYP